MAKISERKNGRKDGGYTRLFGNEEIGSLFSRVHATSISAGTELEKLVFKNDIHSLDEFLEVLPNDKPIWVADKTTIKNSSFKLGNEPDGIIFIMDNNKNQCSIIELKDGDTFDTKKVEGEIETLKKLQNKIAPLIQFKVNYYICGFNSKNKSDLKLGLKNRLEEANLLTGKELCDMMNIDYHVIIENRKKDADQNLDFFIDELLKIDKVREKIKSKL